MQAKINSRKMVDDFSFESSFLSSNAKAYVVEKQSIPLMPDAPGTYHEDFHEKMNHRISFSFLDPLMYGKISIPVYIQDVPFFIGCRTGEEEMVSCFFIT